ncbi:MAG: aminotransferase class V-fold PLP-dependent enzyme, partial [Patescibacteria group bacterium]
ALQFMNCNVEDLGVDLMTISAHKIYGPKGIGALYVRNYELGIRNYGISSIKTLVIHNSCPIIPVITGGGQESGLRSGTENVPYIVGFGKAIELVSSLKFKEFKRLTGLRNYFWKEIKKKFPKAEINGSALLTTSGSAQLPNILNIYFSGSSAQDRCIELDLKGIAVSPGVACAARSAKPSYVIEALGFSNDRASSSLRFSFGRLTTKKELDKVLKNNIICN